MVQILRLQRYRTAYAQHAHQPEPSEKTHFRKSLNAKIVKKSIGVMSGGKKLFSPTYGRTIFKVQTEASRPYTLNR